MTPATSAIAPSDIANGKNAVGFRASVKIVAAWARKEILLFQSGHSSVEISTRHFASRDARPSAPPLLASLFGWGAILARPRRAEYTLTFYFTVASYTPPPETAGGVNVRKRS